MNEYLEFQEAIEKECRSTVLLMQDLMQKTYYLLEQTQELYNSSWGWHGANLETD